MTFFPLPDEFYADPQFAGLPGDAIALWARAGSWSAHQGTDGALKADMIPVLLQQLDPQSPALLVQRGIWKRTRGGFQFVVWPRLASRAYVEAKREDARQRQARMRDRKRAPGLVKDLDSEPVKKRGRKPGESPVDNSGRSDRAGKSPTSQGVLSHRDSRVSHGVSHGVSHTTQSSPVPLSYGERGTADAVPNGRESPGESTNPARATARDRAAAIANCTLCDDRGYTGRVLCDHDPDTPARAERHRAAIQAALPKRVPRPPKDNRTALDRLADLEPAKPDAPEHTPEPSTQDSP